MAMLLALVLCLLIVGTPYALYFDSQLPEQPAAWLGALALVLVSVGSNFITLRLHISYWLHDRHATLTIYRQQQRAEYRNEGLF